jgi:hypothetical protein
MPLSYVERQIREAMERGEFDELPGEGRPIPDLDRPYDPGWWAKKWLRRERLLDEARDLRRDALVEDRRLRAAGRGGEADRRLAELDRELGRINRLLPPGDRVARLRPTEN